jgi:hypothetical protein
MYMIKDEIQGDDLTVVKAADPRAVLTSSRTHEIERAK